MLPRSAGAFLFQSGADKCSTCRHEVCEHRHDELRRIDFLSTVAQDLGIGDEITMQGGREFNGDLDRSVVGDSG